MYTFPGAAPWNMDYQRRLVLYRFAPSFIGYGRAYTNDAPPRWPKSYYEGASVVVLAVCVGGWACERKRESERVREWVREYVCVCACVHLCKICIHMYHTYRYIYEYVYYIYTYVSYICVYIHTYDTYIRVKKKIGRKIMMWSHRRRRNGWVN